MNEGLGYKRIHKVLVKEGFEIGKSPNCVNSMIKKRLKREEFLNQKDKIVYKEFRIMGIKKGDLWVSLIEFVVGFVHSTVTKPFS